MLRRTRSSPLSAACGTRSFPDRRSASTNFLAAFCARNARTSSWSEGLCIRPEDRRILAVERAGTGGCLVDLSFEDEYYCVPLRGAENTKRIMGLLAQLVALNTSTLDLAITPTGPRTAVGGVSRRSCCVMTQIQQQRDEREQDKQAESRSSMPTRARTPMTCLRPRRARASSTHSCA